MIATNSVRPGATTAYRRIQELGLESKVAELDLQGFTVLSPAEAQTAALAQPLLDRILRVAEERGGRKPDLARGSSHAGMKSATGQHLFYLLFEDPVFEQALMNPPAVALIDYLLGEDSILSSMTAMVKGPDDEPLKLHSDGAMLPEPFPAYATVANATYLLSDYSRENGAIFFVPGSHKLCRQPTPAEMQDAESFFTIEAPMGSMIVWHGNTWHGAHPRKTSGLRVNLIMYFCRMFVRSQESYQGACPPEVLARNAERFHRFVGEHLWYGWKSEGPDRAKQAALGGIGRGSRT